MTKNCEMLTQEEINRRKPVWVALSELWLDTELEPSDLERIAKCMKQSGFSVKELRHIYLDEVAPVLYPNLLSPAGEWMGFDEEWLCEAVVQSLGRAGMAQRLGRCLMRPAMTYATERHWCRLHEMMLQDSEPS